MNMNRCQVTHHEWLAHEFGKEAADKMMDGISANANGGMYCVLPSGHDGEHKWMPHNKRKWFTHNGAPFVINKEAAPP